jgi:hypothetical protein
MPTGVLPPRAGAAPIRLWRCGSSPRDGVLASAWDAAARAGRRRRARRRRAGPAAARAVEGRRRPPSRTRTPRPPGPTWRGRSPSSCAPTLATASCTPSPQRRRHPRWGVLQVHVASGSPPGCSRSCTPSAPASAAPGRRLPAALLQAGGLAASAQAGDLGRGRGQRCGLTGGRVGGGGPPVARSAAAATRPPRPSPSGFTDTVPDGVGARSGRGLGAPPRWTSATSTAATPSPPSSTAPAGGTPSRSGGGAAGPAARRLACLPEAAASTSSASTGYRRRLPLADAGARCWPPTAPASRCRGARAPVRLVAPGRRGYWW